MSDWCACTCGLPGCASTRGRTHGTKSCYRAGCRCDACRDAERRRVQTRDAHRAEVAGSPKKAGQVWTGAEMETVMRDDLPIAELAKMLGRSYKAVVTRRAVCRNDPKWASIP